MIIWMKIFRGRTAHLIDVTDMTRQPSGAAVCGVEADQWYDVLTPPIGPKRCARCEKALADMGKVLDIAYGRKES